LADLQELDKDGKKFDRVSRLTSNPTQRDITMTLDYANEFVQFKPQEYFTMTLATSLHEDGDDEEVAGGNSGIAGGPDEVNKKIAKREMWRGGDEGLAEQYEYVMHGKVSLRSVWYAPIGNILDVYGADCRFRVDILTGNHISLSLP
jgi:DNA-directed RNA polymerase I, II, and III subunit RPABC3